MSRWSEPAFRYRPDIWQFDGFLVDAEIDAVTALFLDEAWLEASSLSFGRDKAGFCAEAPTDAFITDGSVLAVRAGEAMVEAHRLVPYNRVE